MVWILLWWHLLANFAQQGTGKLKVEIVDIRNQQGKILVSLFSSAKGFPTAYQYAYRTAELDIPESKKVYVEFTDLPYGDYAVAVLHDENDNKKMDYTLVGLPKEGYSFSNNYNPKLQRPSFRKAVFFLDRPSKALQMKMIYP